MSIKKRIEALDDFFGYLLLCAGVIIEIILASTLTTSRILLFSVPIVAFLLWTVLFIYAYRAKVKFRNEFEMRFLETARAYGYFFFLAFTIPLNSLIAFYPTFLLAPFILIAVGVGLNIILWFLVRIFFTEQRPLMEKKQIDKLKKILFYVGSVSIYYSTAVAGFDLAIVNFASFLNVFTMFILIAIFAIPLYFIYDRESVSRKLELDLANSLKETRLRKKYEYRLKRRTERAEAS